MAENKSKSRRDKTKKKYMLVRHGLMEELDLFEHNQDYIPKTKTRVVVKTDRGLELGSLVGQLCAYKGADCKFSPEQLKQYYSKSNIDIEGKPAGKVIRYADEEDISEEKHLEKISAEEMKFCQELADEMNLKMKLVAAEHIFGGERIIFYFIADGRVDFRELVKRLAKEYQSRIEMRQIGARDEAKILGDVETCGQCLCCRQFLKELKPVNMRMAKHQKATLDPTKISGYCGRLKCCLRYEDKTYTALKRQLPRINTPVKTPLGEGKVVDYQILTQLLNIELENGNTAVYAFEEVEVLKNNRKKSSGKNKNSGKDNNSVEKGKSESGNNNKSKDDKSDKTKSEQNLKNQ
jgi:cell fate regulator YaaT (PSP1 superfamily)